MTHFWRLRMQKVFSRVELNFWNWYILLVGQSAAMRKLISTFYRLTRRQLIHFYLAALVVVTVGFISGILLYGLMAS